MTPERFDEWITALERNYGTPSPFVEHKVHTFAILPNNEELTVEQRVFFKIKFPEIQYGRIAQIK